MIYRFIPISQEVKKNSKLKNEKSHNIKGVTEY